MVSRADEEQARRRWVNLCILQLIRLWPDVHPVTLLLMAEVLWCEAGGMHYEMAARAEVRAWNGKPVRRQ